MDGSAAPRSRKKDVEPPQGEGKGPVEPGGSDPLESSGGDTGGIAAKKLRSFVERIERLETEKADLAADCREVYAEAKGNGFCTRTLRAVIKLRKMEEPDRKEQDALLDLYRAALEV